MQYILDDINYPSNLPATECIYIYIYIWPTASVALFLSELNVKEVTLLEDLHTRTFGIKVMQITMHFPKSADPAEMLSVWYQTCQS